MNALTKAGVCVALVVGMPAATVAAKAVIHAKTAPDGPFSRSPAERDYDTDLPNGATVRVAVGCSAAEPTASLINISTSGLGYDPVPARLANAPIVLRLDPAAGDLMARHVGVPAGPTSLVLRGVTVHLTVPDCAH